MTLIRNSIGKALGNSLYGYRVHSKYVGGQKEMFMKKYVNYFVFNRNN